MRTLRNLLRRWLGVDDAAEKARLALNAAVAARQNIAEIDKAVNAMTKVDVDVGVRGPSTVILTGFYRGKPFIDFQDVGADEFRELVERMREERRRGRLRTIDAPPYFGRALRDIL